MLVGEAPGETEIHNGIPFSGRAGKHLMEFLERIHVTRKKYILQVRSGVGHINGERKKNEMAKKYRKSIIEHQIKEKYLLMHLY